MMGKPYDERKRAEAKRAYKLRFDGATTRQIAEAIGCKPEQVAARVKLGERLISAANQTAYHGNIDGDFDA